MQLVVEQISADLQARLDRGAARGAFQGWIGDYIVYQKDGTTHGYHHSNKGTVPDYTGSESGLYTFAGREPYPVRGRF